jgi:hypothetical protein
MIRGRHSKGKAGFFLTLTGSGIIGPQKRELCPARQYIAEHRQEWRL